MTVIGWWFSCTKTLPHDDGRRIALGRTHTATGKIVPCENGLHASCNILDALQYAPGPILWRVRASGTIVKLSDKLACSSRTYIAGGLDCSATLRHFARLCALDVVHLWDAPPVVVRYLRTGDDSIRAAARAAACTVACTATRAAAMAAQSRRLHRMALAAIRHTRRQP